MNSQRLIVTRRTLLTGIASAGGLFMAGCSQSLPPTYGNLLRMGDLLTYKAHRLLLPRGALAKEYQRHEISSMPATGATDPGDPDQGGVNAELSALYRRLRDGGFADWRLAVTGAVARPRSFSLTELQRLPSRTQITKHTCEEGWSAIAEWTGVPLRTVLEACGVLPGARYVNYYAFDNSIDSIDMIDALSPQTLLTYGMNGRDLPGPHGAPLRIRVENQLGYKSVKFLRQIVVTERFDDPGKLGPLQSGWAWYVGI